MSRDIAALVIVAIAALAPRLWILSQVPAAGPVADMVDYFDRARFLADHGRLYPDAFRVPFFPVALAGAFAIQGQDVHAARLLQCAILTLTAVATCALANGAMSRRRAVIAGLIVAWYPGLLLYTTYVMAEPLFMLLVLTALLLGRYAWKRSALLGAGVAAALAILTRQAGVAVAAGLIVWAAVRPMASWTWRARDRRGVVLAAMVVVGIAIGMAPWVVRNYLVFGRFMPLETTSGITFLIAHYPGATGRYLLSDWDEVHRRYLAREHEEFSRNATAYRLGWNHIVADPQRIAALVPLRLGYLFDLEGREHFWLYSLSYFGEQRREIVQAFGYAIVASFPLLLVAAIVSLAAGPIPRTITEALVIWVLLVMTAQLLTIFGDPRFHLPLVPLLAIIAVRPWRGARASRSTLRLLAGIAVLVAAVSWWNTRLPGHLRAVERAAAPAGWQTPIAY